MITTPTHQPPNNNSRNTKQLKCCFFVPNPFTVTGYYSILTTSTTEQDSMNNKITGETNELIKEALSDFNASAKPGLADFLNDFIESEHELRINCGSDDVWSEYQYTIRQRIQDLQGEIMND